MTSGSTRHNTIELQRHAEKPWKSAVIISITYKKSEKPCIKYVTTDSGNPTITLTFYDIVVKVNYSSPSVA